MSQAEHEHEVIDFTNDDWTPEQWAQWAADADQRDIETGQADAAAMVLSEHGVMPGGVQHRARRLAAATTEAAVGRVVGSPL